MSSERFRMLNVILFTVLFIVDGCALMGKGTQQPTKSYVLNSLYSEESKPQPVKDLHDVGILVGPLRMALYLDRSDIVIRDSQNHIKLAEFAAWAGPLHENFSRVLAENLSVLLSTDRVGIFPGTQAQVFDFNVTVDVNQFDGIPGGKTHLRARWVILDKTRKKVLFEKHSMLSQSAEDDSIETMVASQSRTIADLSREIAEAITALSEGKKPGQ